MPDAQTITTDIPNGAGTHSASPLWRGLPWHAEASARSGPTAPLFRPTGLQNSEDGAAVLDGWTYGMDGGAITAITAEDGSRWAYEHDANSRLTKAERYDTDGTTLLHRYSYTSLLWQGLLTQPLFRPSGLQNSGSRLTKAVLDAVASVTTTTAFAYNDANELVSQTVDGTTTSFAYDAWGRMTSKSDGTYSATYAYRYGNKLASVTSDFPSEGNATYQYDGAGKRRQKTAGGTTTKYRWDAGWNVLNEEDNLGSLMRTHIIDSPLAEVAGILGDVAGTNPATGTYRYYVTDHLGSTRGLYDGSKSALGSYEYTPYGEVYASSGSVALEGLAAAFTGKPWDAAAQMYYFPYRWYSPSAARWITRDPLGMVDGPNVYGYVRGCPSQLVDLLGTSFRDAWDRLKPCLTAVALGIGCLVAAAMAVADPTKILIGAAVSVCGCMVIEIIDCALKNPPPPQPYQDPWDPWEPRHWPLPPWN